MRKPCSYFFLIHMVFFFIPLFISANEFVHPPYKNGDCAICHLQVNGEISKKLTMNIPDLCYLCHAPEKNKWTSKNIIHNPVKGGKCTLCHDPHRSQTKGLLKAGSVNDLCLSCHPSVEKLVKQPKVHPPVKIAGCIVCHDPHAENNEFRLVMPRNEICFMCHPNKKNEVANVKNKHGAVSIRDKCLNCHNPHGSENPKLLKTATVKDVCLSCHNKVMSREEDGTVIKNIAKLFEENKDPHGPNRWGDCAMCHNPHGSNNYRMLKAPFPESFYTSFSQQKYICFMCHDPTPFTNRETEATGFRNGKLSLHWVHVNKQKGISCRDCHDWHATNGLPHHIKDFTKFGNISFPLGYIPTETGGSCAPLCHPRRSYDRVKPVTNTR